MTVDKYNNIVDPTYSQEKYRKKKLVFEHEFDKYESYCGRSFADGTSLVLTISMYGFVGSSCHEYAYGMVYGFVI